MVRICRSTLMQNERLEADCKATFNRWRLFGSSVLGLGDGGYPALARYVPILPERQWVMGARTSDLLDDGFSLLGTNDHPHWTIVFAEPTAATSSGPAGTSPSRYRVVSLHQAGMAGFDSAYNVRGDKSEPFGHTIVPASGSTFTLLKRP